MSVQARSDERQIWIYTQMLRTRSFEERSNQGAFHETLNIASLWKLPVIFVMENNGYDVVTTTAQEDANAAHAEPLAIKAKAYSMPGITIDWTDPLAVHAAGIGQVIDKTCIVPVLASVGRRQCSALE